MAGRCISLARPFRLIATTREPSRTAKHLGFYAYRKAALDAFCGWPESKTGAHRASGATPLPRQRSRDSRSGDALRHCGSRHGRGLAQGGRDPTAAKVGAQSAVPKCALFAIVIPTEGFSPSGGICGSSARAFDFPQSRNRVEYAFRRTFCGLHSGLRFSACGEVC